MHLTPASKRNQRAGVASGGNLTLYETHGNSVARAANIHEDNHVISEASKKENAIWSEVRVVKIRVFCLEKSSYLFWLNLI